MAAKFIAPWPPQPREVWNEREGRGQGLDDLQGSPIARSSIGRARTEHTGEVEGLVVSDVRLHQSSGFASLYAESRISAANRTVKRAVPIGLAPNYRSTSRALT
jgi:hypothetical protein